MLIADSLWRSVVKYNLLVQYTLIFCEINQYIMLEKLIFLRLLLFNEIMIGMLYLIHYAAYELNEDLQ